jgi:hypothetical protein
MRIPMKGAVGSLNAAVAGSILLFEALAQREPAAAPANEMRPAPVEPESVPEAPPTPRRSRAAKAAKVPPASIDAEPRGDDDLLPADAAPKPKRRTRKVIDEAATPPPEDPRA